MTAEIRKIVRAHGRLPVDVDALGEDDDLFQAGMTSHATVNVMLGLENAFDVEFPNRMLKRQVFQSVSSLRRALEELMKEKEAGAR